MASAKAGKTMMPSIARPITSSPEPPRDEDPLSGDATLPDAGAYVRDEGA